MFPIKACLIPLLNMATSHNLIFPQIFTRNIALAVWISILFWERERDPVACLYEFGIRVDGGGAIQRILLLVGDWCGRDSHGVEEEEWDRNTHNTKQMPLAQTHLHKMPMVVLDWSKIFPPQVKEMLHDIKMDEGVFKICPLIRVCFWVSWFFFFFLLLKVLGICDLLC